MRFTLIISLVIAVLAVVFALLNNQDVAVNFGFGDARGPLALVLMITFVIGVLTGVLGMLPGRLKRRREVRSLKKQTHAEPEVVIPDPAASPTDPAVPPANRTTDL